MLLNAGYKMPDLREGHMHYSRGNNRPHELMAYMNAELKTSDHLIRYKCPYKCVSNAQLCLRLLMMIPCVLKRVHFNNKML